MLIVLILLLEMILVILLSTLKWKIARRLNGLPALMSIAANKNGAALFGKNFYAPLPVEAFPAFVTMGPPRPLCAHCVNYVLSGRKCASARRLVSKSKCVYRS